MNAACVCPDDHVESEGVCIQPSAAGLDWRMILLIVILAAVLVIAGIILAFFLRRKKMAKAKQSKYANGSTNSAYEFQAREPHPAPDLVPDDVCIVTDEPEQQLGINGSVENISKSETSMTPGIAKENGSHPKLNGFVPVSKTPISSGRFSADILERKEAPQSKMRSASALPDLAPMPSPYVAPRRRQLASPVDRKSRPNGYRIGQSKTVPRNVPLTEKTIFTSPPLTESSKKPRPNSAPRYGSFGNKNYDNGEIDRLQGMMQVWQFANHVCFSTSQRL